MKTRNELSAMGAKFYFGVYLSSFLSEIDTEFAVVDGVTYYVPDTYNAPDTFNLFKK